MVDRFSRPWSKALFISHQNIYERRGRDNENTHFWAEVDCFLYQLLSSSPVFFDYALCYNGQLQQQLRCLYYEQVQICNITEISAPNADIDSFAPPKFQKLLFYKDISKIYVLALKVLNFAVYSFPSAWSLILLEI